MTVMDALKQFYRRIDRQSERLALEHAGRLKCGRGCSACCVDELTVLPVEAEHIRQHCGPVLTERPGPAGRCAFLDKAGACRIYAHRPYVCRTQGLPLRWLESDDRGDWLDYRDICPLNEEGPPLQEIPAESCWTIGPAEQHLAELQRRHDPAEPERVALRSLFRS